VSGFTNLAHSKAALIGGVHGSHPCPCAALVGGRRASSSAHWGWRRAQSFLQKALMPLHKPKCVGMYHQQLAYCVTQARAP